MCKGNVSATLSAGAKRYRIGLSQGKRLDFRRFDPSKFQGDLDLEIIREQSFAPLLTQNFAKKKSILEPVRRENTSTLADLTIVETPARPKAFRNIDVLVVYSARALTRIGSAAALEARIAE